MLLHDIEKPSCFTMDSDGVGHAKNHQQKSSDTAKKMLQNLRYPKKTIEHVVKLIRLHDIKLQLNEVYIKKFINQHQERFLRDLIEVKRADAKAKKPNICEHDLKVLNQFEKLTNDIIEFSPPIDINKLKIDGNDLISLGFYGPEIGKVKNKLCELVNENKLENERYALINKVQEYMSIK